MLRNILSFIAPLFAFSNYNFLPCSLLCYPLCPSLYSRFTFHLCYTRISSPVLCHGYVSLPEWGPISKTTCYSNL